VNTYFEIGSFLICPAVAVFWAWRAYAWEEACRALIKLSQVQRERLTHYERLIEDLTNG
jgi:hypothetical protein